jgi:cytidylate kinase
MDDTTNIAFAGLTAAGKTTHAKLLAEKLNYDYISATDILLDILGVHEPGDQIWFTRLKEIELARGDGSVDAELEERLITLNRERQRTVFDTWALAWIGDDPLVRIWIESDLASRVRKCIVSQRIQRLSYEECKSLILDKDAFNRSMFLRRRGFDLFEDRGRYDIVLCNTHLIPEATHTAAHSGIDRLAPVVYAAVSFVLRSNESGARATQQENSREVLRITVPTDSPCRTSRA